MKIEFKESKQDFTPFEFTVKVETLEEARAWYAIFNYTQHTIMLGIRGTPATKIRASLESKSGSNICAGEDEVIANSVTYNQFYCS